MYYLQNFTKPFISPPKRWETSGLKSVKNLFTCYDNTGKSFILNGAKYLNINYYFNKKIAHLQSIAYQQQLANGAKFGKDTRQIKKLYAKKQKQLHHYFHAVTKYIVNYCIMNQINTVVIGDIKNIRNNANLGHKNNQKMHSLPFDKIYKLLAYKLARAGIHFIKQKEAYSSQCSPLAEKVSKKYATPNKRIRRGLYADDRKLFNADSVGAFNILRLYNQAKKLTIATPVIGLSNPCRLNVSV